MRTRTRYEGNEARVIPLLCTQGSVSSAIFAGLALSRALIKEVMLRLRHSRVLQVTFGSVVCATRFKFFRCGTLLPTECQYCGQVDSFAHLVSCVNIGAPPQDRGALVDYLVELTGRAYNVNPGMPHPVR